jgi:vacuolar-type H+-ATPase subunit I/STV1
VSAQNQGYTQDADNYYVWYTTHFSTHQIKIMFTSTTPTLTPAGTNGQTNWLQIAYGVGVAMVIVAIVVGCIYLVINGKRGKN